MTSLAIDVRNLVKTYPGAARPAVNDLTLSVREGEIYGLLGPNGAGKTTTIEILEGLRERTSGTVEVLGVDPADRKERTATRQRTGMVLQQLGAERYLRVREAVEQFASFYEAPIDPDEALSLVGLELERETKIPALSGGQTRRLDVAIALVGRPILLFLDEPTTGFDPSARQDFWTTLQRLNGDGMTIVLTTHYLDEAQALADRIGIMTRGSMVAEGTPQELQAYVDVSAVISFESKSAPANIDGLKNVRGDRWEMPTNDPVRDSHAITEWALTKNVALRNYSVTQPELESVYLGLTRSTDDST